MWNFVAGLLVGFVLGQLLRFHASDWRGDEPSQKQREYADDLGILIPPGCTKGELSDLISEVTGK